jgi:hypothetical protein
VYWVHGDPRCKKMVKCCDAAWAKSQFGVKNAIFHGVRSQNHHQNGDDKIELGADLQVKNRQNTVPPGQAPTKSSKDHRQMHILVILAILLSAVAAAPDQS